MAVFTTIAKNTDHFEDKVYQGSSSSQAITGLSFSPDIWWINARNATTPWFAQNSTRGINKNVFYGGDENLAEETTSIVTSRDSGGLTLTSHSWINTAGVGFISTFLKAGNASTSSNSNGSITSTVQANDTGGISIVKFTGTGSAGTVGHGLSTAPDCIWIKNLTDVQHWRGYWHGGNRSGQGNVFNETKSIDLWDTSAIASGTAFWNDTKPTSSVFSVGSDDGTNKSGKDMIAYCFSNRNGFMRSGTYQGNGNVHGPFIFTGFQPQAVIIHRYSASGENWSYKSQVNTTTDNSGAAATTGGATHGNEIEQNNKMDTNVAESNQDHMDFFSNGFAPATTDGKSNSDGFHYIYTAFGKMPMISTNNILATAMR